MGVEGLLRVLQGVQIDTHISRYSGQRVAIDGFAWLHRGAYSCAADLVQGHPATGHIQFCLRRAQMLIEHHVTPIFVFDGASLPAKRGTNEERRKSRQASKQKALECLGLNQKAEAFKLFSRAVDISPSMVYSLIQHLSPMGVEAIVAPYEADAQLAFLSLSGFVDAIISEDSDLLVYGCRKVLFKLDDTGKCKEISAASIAESNILPQEIFCEDYFVCGCVLAGCDYAKSVEGIGVKKAFKLVSQWKGDWRQIIRSLQLDGYTIPPNYEDGVRRAVLTFRHQTVYDPIKKQSVRLRPMGSNFQDGDIDVLGALLPDDIARAVCSGVVNPHTLEPFDSSNAMSEIPSTNTKEKKSQTVRSSRRQPIPAVAAGQKTLSSLWNPQTKEQRKAAVVKEIFQPTVESAILDSLGSLMSSERSQSQFRPPLKQGDNRQKAMALKC